MSHAYDAELARVIDALPAPDLTDLPALRAMLDADPVATSGAVDLTGVAVRDLDVPETLGAAPVRVRVYEDLGQSRTGGAILDLHGGGFVAGSLAMTHRSNVRLCRRTGAAVVAVDYRLAPEHPYPAALHDCHAALCWLVEEASELGISRERIAVRGVSAGGGLAAGLTLLLRDTHGPSLCFQFLRTPMLDDRLVTLSSRRFSDTPLWTSQNVLDGWQAYLGPGRAGGEDTHATAAPARAGDLSGLPPAYVSVMQFDPLRDEGIAYTQRLLDAGVPVELHLFPGTFHGSSAVARSEVSRRELEEELAVLRRHVGDRPSVPAAVR